MRGDLAVYIPSIASEQTLMCCLCGRFLLFDDFDIEHLIPKQALKNDPEAVRLNPLTPKNIRSRTLLLCRKPLFYKNSKLYGGGCNSWKGRFYDKPISDLLSGRVLSTSGARANDNHIIGGLVLGYLAMVAEFGYRVCLMKSDVLMREQFFRPGKFHRSLGSRHQILLGGQPFKEAEDSVWDKPFSFKYENNACYVTIRNYVVVMPADSDPSSPIVRSVRIVPSKYAFRPTFGTSFR